MNRREFMGWVSVGAIASSLPVALAACNPTPEPETNANSPDPNRADPTDGFKSLGTTEDLEQFGKLLSRSTGVVVVRNSETSELVALNSICTHQGCIVDWDEEQQAFSCPCHDSRFSPVGEALTGPATKPLEPYEVKTQGSQILVKVGG